MHAGPFHRSILGRMDEREIWSRIIAGLTALGSAGAIGRDDADLLLEGIREGGSAGMYAYADALRDFPGELMEEPERMAAYLERAARDAADAAHGTAS